MVKVKMLVRYTGNIGKMEPGLEYLLPPDYARELASHGLAELVIASKPEPSIPVVKVQQSKAMAQALKEARAKNQAIIDKAKKRR